jgi:hypothetical protein
MHITRIQTRIQGSHAVSWKKENKTRLHMGGAVHNRIIERAAGMLTCVYLSPYNTDTDTDTDTQGSECG